VTMLPQHVNYATSCRICQYEISIKHCTLMWLQYNYDNSCHVQQQKCGLDNSNNITGSVPRFSSAVFQVFLQLVEHRQEICSTVTIHEAHTTYILVTARQQKLHTRREYMLTDYQGDKFLTLALDSHCQIVG